MPFRASRAEATRRHLPGQPWTNEPSPPGPGAHWEFLSNQLACSALLRCMLLISVTNDCCFLQLSDARKYNHREEPDRGYTGSSRGSTQKYHRPSGLSAEPLPSSKARLFTTSPHVATTLREPQGRAWRTRPSSWLIT